MKQLVRNALFVSMIACLIGAFIWQPETILLALLVMLIALAGEGLFAFVDWLSHD